MSTEKNDRLNERIDAIAAVIEKAREGDSEAIELCNSFHRRLVDEVERRNRPRIESKNVFDVKGFSFNNAVMQSIFERAKGRQPVTLRSEDLSILHRSWRDADRKFQEKRLGGSKGGTQDIISVKTNTEWRMTRIMSYPECHDVLITINDDDGVLARALARANNEKPLGNMEFKGKVAEDGSIRQIYLIVDDMGTAERPESSGVRGWLKKVFGDK